MEINLRLIPPCRLHESAPRNPCTLVATFFSVENKRLPSSGSPPRNQLLDLPRSIDHSRPRQPFNDPCRISANHNTERFQVQCSSSRPSVWNQIETDPSILVVPVESACCLRKLWKNWSILRLFSREKIIIFEYAFERFALEEHYMNVICSIFERF